LGTTDAVIHQLILRLIAVAAVLQLNIGRALLPKCSASQKEDEQGTKSKAATTTPEAKKRRFTILVTDAQGNPVPDAQVGQAAIRDLSERNSDWVFRGDVSAAQIRPLFTDANGETQMVQDVARERTLIERGFEQFPLVARHPAKKLIGISQTPRHELLSWSTSQPPVAIKLMPGCRVHGRVESVGLAKLNRHLKSVTVTVMVDERSSVLVLASPRPDYELLLPPGEFKLMVLGGRDVEVVVKDISVPVETKELEIETINLPPSIRVRLTKEAAPK
jgi:hypothetical protein